MGRGLQAPSLHTAPGFRYQKFISPHVHVQLKLTAIWKRKLPGLL